MLKLQKDSRGLAHVAMIVLVVVVLGAIAGAGYYVMTKQKDKKSSDASAVTPATSKAVQDECVKQINDKDFCKFASNFTLDASYKATFTTESSEGTTVSTMEVENKDKTSTVTKKDGKEISAIVSIGKDSYVKDLSDGKWTKYTSETSTESSGEPNVDFKDDPATPEAEDKTQYKSLGKEACGKLTCFKYQIIAQGDTGDQFVWFDTKDYRLQKWVFSNGEGKTTFEYSYESVKVSAPSPVKEAPNPANMTQAEIQAQIDAAMAAYGQQ